MINQIKQFRVYHWVTSDAGKEPHMQNPDDEFSAPFIQDLFDLVWVIFTFH